MTDPTPTRDEAVPLPDSRELPPMTERGLAGQLMDAAWPHYGGNNQPPDFWNDFGEGIRFALHYLASAPAPASGRVDAGLPGPNKQLDRVRIGEGEYVRADEAIKTVMELQRQLYDADKRLASLSPAETPVSEAEPVAALAIVRMFKERIERHGNWDEGCFYYGSTSASELQEPLRLATAALACACAAYRKSRHLRLSAGDCSQHGRGLCRVECCQTGSPPF